MTAKAVLSQAASAVAAELKTLGYRKSGLRYVRRGAETISLIELQPGRASSAEELSFVVNFGVMVISLLEGYEPMKPTYTDCHWGCRVAGQDGAEIWWMVREGDSWEDLANRLRTVFERVVLPALDCKQREDALVALWRTGYSPLLVEAQRLLFLGMLLHRAGRYDEFIAVRSELETKAHDGFGVRALEKLRRLEC